MHLSHYHHRKKHHSWSNHLPHITCEAVHKLTPPTSPNTLIVFDHQPELLYSLLYMAGPKVSSGFWKNLGTTIPHCQLPPVSAHRSEVPWTHRRPGLCSRSRRTYAAQLKASSFKGLSAAGGDDAFLSDVFGSRKTSSF